MHEQPQSGGDEPQTIGACNPTHKCCTRSAGIWVMSTYKLIVIVLSGHQQVSNSREKSMPRPVESGGPFPGTMSVNIPIHIQGGILLKSKYRLTVLIVERQDRS